MNDSFWENDSFEEALINGIFALQEPRNSLTKLVDPLFRVDAKDLLEGRELGLYFPPKDRIAFDSWVDLKNDGFLTKATAAFIPDEVTSDKYDGAYLMHGYAKALRKLPVGIVALDKGTPYQIITQTVTNDKGVLALKQYAVITSDGAVKPCYHKENGRFVSLDERMIETGAGGKSTGHLALAYTFYADRKYFWNVDALDENGKVSFGVKEEQIQSLFYARSLPMTGTGRKKPILHWVQSHKRRTKNGIGIDVSEHLRGIHEFEMGGVEFRISRPMKEPQQMGALRLKEAV